MVSVIKNTGDLVNYISEETGLTRAKSQDALRAVVRGITCAISSDGADAKLNVKDLGVFRRVHRKARKGVNPKTGDPIHVEARDTVGFKPSQSFRDLVN